MDFVPIPIKSCLVNRLPGWTRLRTCNSDDPENAEDLGLCTTPRLGLDHMEIHIASQNWEAVFFEAWIMQILLSEMLNVPTTIETGHPDKNVNLYDPQSQMDYGSSNLWDSLERCNEVGDCHKVPNKNAEMTEALNLIPEIWSGDEKKLLELEEQQVIEPHKFVGVVRFESWFVPQYTGEQDPTLLSYIGLMREENRRKLGERFKRPTTWQDYCDLVSVDNGLTDDDALEMVPLIVKVGAINRLMQAARRSVDRRDHTFFRAKHKFPSENRGVHLLPPVRR